MTRLLPHLSPIEIEALALADAYAAGSEAARTAYAVHALAHYAATVKRLARCRRDLHSVLIALARARSASAPRHRPLKCPRTRPGATQRRFLRKRDT